MEDITLETIQKAAKCMVERNAKLQQEAAAFSALTEKYLKNLTKLTAVESAVEGLKEVEGEEETYKGIYTRLGQLYFDQEAITLDVLDVVSNSNILHDVFIRCLQALRHRSLDPSDKEEFSKLAAKFADSPVREAAAAPVQVKEPLPAQVPRKEPSVPREEPLPPYHATMVYTPSTDVIDEEEEKWDQVQEDLETMFSNEHPEAQELVVEPLPKRRQKTKVKMNFYDITQIQVKDRSIAQETYQQLGQRMVDIFSDSYIVDATRHESEVEVCFVDKENTINILETILISRVNVTTLSTAWIQAQQDGMNLVDSIMDVKAYTKPCGKTAKCNMCRYDVDAAAYAPAFHVTARKMCKIHKFHYHCAGYMLARALPEWKLVGYPPCLGATHGTCKY